MKTLKRFLSVSMLLVFSTIGLSGLNFTLADPGDTVTSPYDAMLDSSVDDQSLKIIKDDVVQKTWSELFNQQVLNLIDYAIDVFVAIWIAIAFFWAYKIMFSGKEDAFKEWINLVVYGIIWVIIMVSAKFIAWSLVDNFDANLDRTSISGVKLASDLYENLMYPFIKVALYLVIWVLFIMMAIKVVNFVISTDDAAKKKAWWIILRCAIWILIVMWSKQMVEGIMWRQEKVLNDGAQVVTWWEAWMWEEILNFGSIPIIAQIINWVMSLAMFVVLVLIVIQAYRMFAKPDDPKNRERLKKTLLYVIIWVLVIWASYVISNVLVVNNIPIDSA